MTTSAGLIVFREREGDGELEVLLGHMGGPFWARRDDGAWSIPKGELDEDEAPRDAARREFEEELGHPPPEGELLELGAVRQKAGKIVVGFAVAGDFDPETIRPGTFEMQWPPRSGRMRSFPEIDRVAWFDLATARSKVVQGQVALLDRLAGSARGSSQPESGLRPRPRAR